MTKTKITKSKNKTYEVEYYFDGYGIVKVRAKSQREADEKFYEGEWQGQEKEWGENYVVNGINKITKRGGGNYDNARDE